MLDLILRKILRKISKKKYSFIDLGTHSSKTPVNYPDYAHKLCKKYPKTLKILVF